MQENILKYSELANEAPPRSQKKEVTNRMGDFNSIIDSPPARKLDVLNRLIPEKCTEQELLGEQFFWGKAECGTSRYCPAFVDDHQHDRLNALCRKT